MLRVARLHRPDAAVDLLGCCTDGMLCGVCGAQHQLASASGVAVACTVLWVLSVMRLGIQPLLTQHRAHLQCSAAPLDPCLVRATPTTVAQTLAPQHATAHPHNLAQRANNNIPPPLCPPQNLPTNPRTYAPARPSTTLPTAVPKATGFLVVLWSWSHTCCAWTVSLRSRGCSCCW